MIREIFDLQNPWRTEPGYVFRLHPRAILPELLNQLDELQILGLIGSRQVGKSSLSYMLIQELLKSGKSGAPDIFYFNLDDLKLHELFASMPDFVHFVDAVPGKPKKYIFLDEVPRLSSPGLFLKELYDLHLNLKIVYTGSSQLEIRAKVKENLVGRVRQYEVQRLSFEEYFSFVGPITHQQALEQMLLYGGYPAVTLAGNNTERQLRLKDIYQSYVQKDLVDFLRVDNVNAFNNLLGLLANQIGQLLNIDGLAKTLRIPRKEVERYLEILESTFVIRRIYPFFENYGKEITKTPKVYFMDLGLRNFALNNFSSLSLRNDRGNLFENFYFLELVNHDIHGLNKINFWRTTNQTEVDFIVNKSGNREAIEVKWDSSSPPKSFETLRKHYPDMRMRVVSNRDFQARS